MNWTQSHQWVTKTDNTTAKPYDLALLEHTCTYDQYSFSTFYPLCHLRHHHHRRHSSPHHHQQRAQTTPPGVVWAPGMFLFLFKCFICPNQWLSGIRSSRGGNNEIGPKWRASRVIWALRYVSFISTRFLIYSTHQDPLWTHPHQFLTRHVTSTPTPTPYGPTRPTTANAGQRTDIYLGFEYA